MWKNVIENNLLLIKSTHIKTMPICQYRLFGRKSKNSLFKRVW